MAYEKELETARKLCAEAAAVQLSSRQPGRAFERKADDSPVTEVDRRCERLIVEKLASAFPADGVLGEEGDAREGSSGRTWIIDPLDGTRPYLRGIPTYSVLLALEENDEPVVGVIHLSEMNVVCWARKGGGAFCNGEAIHVSGTASLEAATCSALGHVERAGEERGRRLLDLMRRWDYAYGFMDAYTYACVAMGKLDACVNLLDRAWDCAPAACIVTEAGGRYSDLDGKRTVHSGSIVVSNGALHDSILAHFGARNG